MLGIAGDVYWKDLDNWSSSTAEEEPRMQPAFAHEINK